MGQSYQRWYFTLFLGLFFVTQSGCMTQYYISSSYEQMKLLSSRKDIDKVLKDPNVSQELKERLKLGREAQSYAVEQLGFAKTKNYQSFVKLDRPYVSWIVSVAHKDKLEYRMFDYAIVGKLPYKGFFNEEAAKKEAEKFKKKNFDVVVRGVTAYSTLGWFEDPILSSMTDRSEVAFVEVILHESAHATIFIEDHADFNEQLASFLGLQGAKHFYLHKEGEKSESLKKIETNLKDERLFAQFLKAEIKSLKDWYTEKSGDFTEDERQSRLAEIQKRYKEKIQPKIKTKSFDYYFGEGKLNNAYLLSLATYMEDLADFEDLYRKKGKDLRATISYLKTLEDSKDPAETLKQYVSEN